MEVAPLAGLSDDLNENEVEHLAVRPNRPMKCTLISTEGPWNGARIEVSGTEISVTDAFSNDKFSPKPGDLIDVSLSALAFDESDGWEDVVTGNPGKDFGIRHRSGARYFISGQVTNQSPLEIDCGIAKIDADITPDYDLKLGEFVTVRVFRITAYITQRDPNSD
jgi:hypothetical protein